MWEIKEGKSMEETENRLERAWWNGWLGWGMFAVYWYLIKVLLFHISKPHTYRQSHASFAAWLFYKRFPVHSMQAFVVVPSWAIDWGRASRIFTSIIRGFNRIELLLILRLNIVAVSDAICLLLRWFRRREFHYKAVALPACKMGLSANVYGISLDTFVCCWGFLGRRRSFKRRVKGLSTEQYLDSIDF